MLLKNIWKIRTATARDTLLWMKNTNNNIKFTHAINANYNNKISHNKNMLIFHNNNKHFSTFKRHKQSRKTSKQVQNKQEMWRNKLNNEPRRGAKGKYGKTRAEKRAHYQMVKQQKMKNKLFKQPKKSNKNNNNTNYIQEQQRYLPQNYEQRLAIEGDEADMLSHFTADNDLLSSQQNQMSKLYDILLKNREWKNKTQYGYTLATCTPKTQEVYLEIDEVMFKIDPNSIEYLRAMDEYVAPKVYDRLDELIFLEEKYLRNENERKHRRIMHDKNYLYAKLVEGYATYASYRNEDPKLQKMLYEHAIGIYREMFRNGTLPTLPMYEALMQYELLRDNYEGVLSYLSEAQSEGYEMTMKMANIKLMACAKVQLSPAHQTWGDRRTTNHILYLTEKCFVDHFNNLNGFFPNFKTFKALMIAYSRCGELQSAYRLMSILDSHSFIEVSIQEYSKMFELLFETHYNSIIVPRKERKRVKFEINRLKRIRQNKTLAAPKLDWNFLRLSMFPKREDDAVEKLNEFWGNPFGVNGDDGGEHDFLGAGTNNDSDSLITNLLDDSNVGSSSNNNNNNSDNSMEERDDEEEEKSFINIADDTENVFLIDDKDNLIVDNNDDDEIHDDDDDNDDSFSKFHDEEYDNEDDDFMEDPKTTVMIKYAADAARAEAEFDGTYKEEDWEENIMDYMKDSITSPQDQHIESIGLKELVTTTTDVQVLRSNFNEESVIESALNCFDKMLDAYEIQPNIHHLNKLLRMYTSTYRLTRARELFELFESKYNVEPNPKTYKLLIEMYSRSNRFQMAKEIYEDSVKRGVGVSSTILQGTILRSFLRHKKYKEALKVMKNMSRRGVYINERDVYQLRDAIEKKTLTYSSGKKVDRRVLNELVTYLPEDPHRVRKIMKEHLKQHKKVKKIVKKVKF